MMTFRKTIQLSRLDVFGRGGELVFETRRKPIRPDDHKLLKQASTTGNKKQHYKESTAELSQKIDISSALKRNSN